MTKEKKGVYEENGRIAGWANALRIICNIFKVFSIIGIVLLAFVLILIPKMASEIKIDDKKIELFGQKIEYSFKEVDFLTIRIDGKEQTINTKDVYKYINLADIENINVKKVGNILMIDIVLIMITCVIEFMIFNMLSIMLSRIREEEKAFVEDGHKVIQKVMWYAIAMKVIGMVVGLCTSIAFASTNFKYSVNIDLEFVLAMCILYFVSLLYKRGEDLENK